MLKSVIFILALSGAMLTTSMAVSAQTSDKDINSTSVNKNTFHYVPGSNILCKVGHIFCKK